MAKRPTGAEEPPRTGRSEGPASDGAARPGHGLRGLAELKSRLAAAADFRASRGRPFVVLSYAQSVDGSIAGPKRERVRLSGPESMRLTYAIRALCDTILVGIGTVLADDPSLTVKQVPGKSPQPIVLDTRLRTPGKASLLRRPDARPWLIHGPGVPPSRAQALIAAGIDVLGYRPPLAALTATATRSMQEAIVEALAMRQPAPITTTSIWAGGDIKTHGMTYPRHSRQPDMSGRLYQAWFWILCQCRT